MSWDRKWAIHRRLLAVLIANLDIDCACIRPAEADAVLAPRDGRSLGNPKRRSQDSDYRAKLPHDPREAAAGRTQVVVLFDAQQTDVVDGLSEPGQS